MNEIKSLTGLRTIACFLVIIHHYVNYTIPYGFFSQMLYHCYLVVDLFFILSGFVMAMTYGDMFEERTTFGIWLSFMGRRVARVYPMYTVMVVVLTLLVLAGMSSRIAPSALPAMVATNMLLVQSWFGLHSLEWPMWSISAEWATYLVFPFLLWATFGRRSWAVIVVIVCFAMLTVLALYPGWTMHHPERNGALNHSYTWWGMMTRCVTEFLLGLVTYRVSRTPLARILANSRYAGIVLVAFVVCLLAWPVSDLFVLALLPPLIVAISTDHGILAAFLSCRPVHRCGVWSYSIYLLHPLPRHLCWKLTAMLQAAGLSHTPALLVAIVPVLLLVIAMASVTFKLIEKPGRRFLQKQFTTLELKRAAYAVGEPLKAS